MLLTLGPLTSARAGSLSLPGQWQQVVSNAGRCDRCRIAIKQQGPVLRVTSNNGWSAIVEADKGGASGTASGVGRWKSDLGNRYNQMSFTVRFTLTDGQLYMNMTVPMENGASNVIKAIFEKLPPGRRVGGPSTKA